MFIIFFIGDKHNSCTDGEVKPLKNSFQAKLIANSSDFWHFFLSYFLPRFNMNVKNYKKMMREYLDGYRQAGF